jgi:hypothetical protein
MVFFILLPMKMIHPIFFRSNKRLFRNLPVILLIFILCTFTIIPTLANESSGIPIPLEASVTDSVFVGVDNDLIATYGGSSNPTGITIYHPDGTLYRSISLTNDAMKLESLEISDGRIFYTEYDTSEPWYSRDETVYVFDLSNGEKRTIYTTPFGTNVQQKITRIAADGDHVILHKEGGGYSIILHTLSTKSNLVIISSHDWIHGLAIEGDHILWGCERTDKEPGREIHVYTISTAKDYIIPESKSIKTWGYGDISGDIIVWDMATNDPDTSGGYPNLINAGDTIYMTNITTGKTVSIESVNAPARPFISGNTIAYLKKPEQDYDNPENGVIRTFDIKTGSFNEFGSKIAFIQEVKRDYIIWGRYKPMSFFVSSLSGTFPMTTSSATTTGVPDPKKIDTASTPVPESPAGAIIIVLAVTSGIVVHITMKRKRGR